MKRSNYSKMKSENHITQDHCYLNDSGSEEIGFNVELQDETLPSSAENNSRQYILIKKDSIDYSYTNSPSIVYLPAIKYCTDHTDLYLHEDDKLVKPGDKFDTHNDFIQYLKENAKRWCFYYKCSDSRKPNTAHETYIYTCVYLRNKEKYIKKGLRKRTNNIKTNCPCRIKLKHLPNEKQLTVVFVCNHHDHLLSEQEFYKLQHGRRLPPYIKEEIMDLISLQVEMDKIKKYVQMQTGFNMNRTFFYQIERTMRLRNLERHITTERLIDLSLKMNMVDESRLEEADKRNETHRQENLENVDLKNNLGDNRTENTHSLSLQHMKKVSPKKSVKRLRTNENAIRKVCNFNENLTNDTLNMQSVVIVQGSLESETQSTQWLTDHTVSMLPNGEMTEQNDFVDISTVSTHSQIDNDNNPNNYKAIVVSEIDETTENNVNDNCVAYETVVTDTVDENHIQAYENAGIVQANLTNLVNIDLAKDNHDILKAQDTISHSRKDILEFLPDQNIEFSGYVHFNGEMSEDVQDFTNVKDSTNAETIEGHEEATLDNSAICNVHVDSSDDGKTTKYPLVPVFDVYLKDGNVTGFVVNDGAVQNLKQTGLEKGVQTTKNDNCVTATSNTIEINSSIAQNEPESYIEQISQDEYQKHEYIHKYNINQYMLQPYFPKYIELLSQEIHIDTWRMVKNVQNERAMFKMTTTQRDKEGDTRIWYLTIRFE